MPEISFPSDFMWGVATASYQIEGAARDDGRGPSVWDTFSHTPGKVAKGETGDVACDHYHRYEEDVRLVRELGIPNYRFSISWSRIFPHGTGCLNQRGLDFYSKLVDTLLRENVKPAATLFHWDYPQALEDSGGWSNPDAPQWFGEYAETVFKALGDRVDLWITLNEPWCHSWLGNGVGTHAPGNKSDSLPYQVGHGLLLGHGEAVARYRALGLPGKIGLTTNHTFGVAASDSPEDLKAKEQFDHWNAGWFLDPLYKGDYPEYMKQRYAMPEFTPETSKLVSQPLDFMGLNFYFGDVVKWNPEHMNDAEQMPSRIDNTTQMGWQRLPETFAQCLVETHKRYKPEKIVVFENGCAYEDKVENGRVHDPQRMQFIRDYISAMGDAIREGVPVAGYFVWSLLDNFEWAEGYRPTFGLVRVDYATQQRIPKDSAFMFRDIIKANAV